MIQDVHIHKKDMEERLMDKTRPVTIEINVQVSQMDSTYATRYVAQRKVVTSGTYELLKIKREIRKGMMEVKDQILEDIHVLIEKEREKNDEDNV